MHHTLQHLFLLILLNLPAQTVAGQDTIDLYPAQQGSLICWTETRTTPRPLKIYYLRVGLRCPNLEVFTMTGEDPDGTETSPWIYTEWL
ncbi:MAG: hypothetical protein WC865_15340 [Bacteroidales bacterium]